MHDFARALYGGTFFYFDVAAQDNRTDVVLLQVQDQAVYIVAKIKQLACHGFGKPVDVRNAVTDFDDRSHIVNVHIDVVVLNLLLDYGGNFFGIHLHITGFHLS